MILAKSDPPESLESHTRTVLKVFKTIKDYYPNVPEICEKENFWDLLFLSLFLHDFGKGASGFQQSLLKSIPWGYRHEILSAGFVSFLNLSDSDKDAVGMAIITHHKDVYELRNKYSTNNSVSLKKYYDAVKEIGNAFEELVELFSKVPEWSLHFMGHSLKISEIPTLDKMRDVYRTTVTKYYKGVVEPDEKTNLHGKLGIFLKGFLTACDHLGSSHHDRVLEFPDLRKKILEIFPELREIQSMASNTTSDSFLIAPTGEGKTEASILWAQNNQNNARGNRMFYFLPYTASINALYRRFRDRYIDNPDYIGVEHGKASYYLYKEFGESEDYLGNARTVREIRNLTKQIYRPIKILTVFQILKAFFGLKGFEQQISELVGGLIIVDEVHAYDVRTSALMLSMFKIMKEQFGCSFLIMSATIPSFLKEIYKKQIGISKEIRVPEQNLRSMNRHRVKVLEGEILDWEFMIIESLRAGKRVLVVCNTVDRAIQVFERVKEVAKNPLLLHSRFTVGDRESKEKRLIFSENPHTADDHKVIDLLVGTQAIEVSLDIDYDVLFTEPAPIDALIQRFGRVNRKSSKDIENENVFIASVGSESDKWIYRVKTRVEKTLCLLRNHEFPSEYDIQEILDEVYGDGYNEDELMEFNFVLRQFGDIWDNLNPFIETVDRGKFFEMFDSINVVPFCFVDEHQKMIQEKKYLEAMKYSVRIKRSQYRKLLMENVIERINDSVYVSCKYDYELGLRLKDTEETVEIL